MSIPLVESSVKIYFTREYGTFKFLKGNRDINELKVKKIIKAIKGGLNILKLAPIIVNEDFEILDGQHRFTVAMQLKENIFFVIAKELDLTSVPKMNQNSSNWKSADYLNSYVDLKKQAYIELEKIVQEYDGISISIAAKLIHHGGLGANDNCFTDIFQSGDLTVNHLKDARFLLDTLKDFEPYTKNPYSRNFIKAMQILNKNGKYDHALMLEKLQLSGLMIEKFESDKSLLVELETIINWKSRNRIIIH